MISYVRLAAPVVHRGGVGTCGPGSRSGPVQASGNRPDGVARRLARRSHHGPQNLRPGTRDRRRVVVGRDSVATLNGLSLLGKSPHDGDSPNGAREYGTHLIRADRRGHRPAELGSREIICAARAVGVRVTLGSESRLGPSHGWVRVTAGSE
jgi:hypothetical protein